MYSLYIQLRSSIQKYRNGIELKHAPDLKIENTATHMKAAAPLVVVYVLQGEQSNLKMIGISVFEIECNSVGFGGNVTGEFLETREKQLQI